MVKLALVIPCYNEEEVINDSLNKIIKFYDQLIEEKLISNESFITMIDDGSRDKTWNLIEEATKHPFVCGIKLSRNYGQQNAILAALTKMQNRADCFITLDIDLQDDLEAVREMVKHYIAGSQIVYGVRKNRKRDSFFKRFTAVAFYKVMRFLGIKSIYNHSDFRLMSNKVIKHLLEFPERNMFLRGVVILIGYKSSSVYYARQERLLGKTKYNFRKLFGLAWEGITSFSVKPLRIILNIGFIMLFLVGCSFITFLILSNFYSFNWFYIFLFHSIYLVCGIILFSIGIACEYIGKIYQEIKARPRFFLEKTIYPDKSIDDN